MTCYRTAAQWQELVAASIERGKAEILADMQSGRVEAAAVHSFADLHDFVDANEYGGLCEPGWLEYTQDDGRDGEWTAGTEAAANAVQAGLDAWVQDAAAAAAERGAYGRPEASASSREEQ